MLLNCSLQNGSFYVVNFTSIIKRVRRLGGSVVEHLPSTQVMILGCWDQVPHQAARRESVSPSAYVSASLSLSVFHK